MTITNASDLVIETLGVTFVFYYGYGVDISNCRNLTVRGLTLDYNPVNYAQGTVVTVTNATSVATSFDDAFLPLDTTTEPFNNQGGTTGAKVRFWYPSSKKVLPKINVNSQLCCVEGEKERRKMMQNEDKERLFPIIITISYYR